jgi:hypothetical protein
MLTEIAKIAWRNTLKNWRHSVSALLSLAASFVSLVVFDVTGREFCYHLQG